MKTKLIAVLGVIIVALSALAQQEIYLVDGIYYTIVSEQPKEVAVSCSEQSKEIGDNMMYFLMSRDLLSYDWMEWKGNSYADDVIVPPSVIIPELGEDPYVVSHVDDAAFLYCSNLRSVTLPETVRYIANGAFYGCTLIEEISLPDNIEYVGDFVFMHCKKMRHVHFPNSCETFGENCFTLCGQDSDDFFIDGLEGVKTLGLYGFAWSYFKNFPYMPSLKHIHGLSANYMKAETIDLSYLSGTDTNFEKKSLSYNKNLSKLVLPMHSPDNLGDIFYACPSLKYIKIFNDEPPVLNSDWSAEVSPDCVLDVPDESVELYKSAQYWKNFPVIKGHSASAGNVSAEGLTVNAGNGFLSVRSGIEANVYDTCGRLIGTGKNLQLNLPAGLYIVTAGDEITKTIVR